MRRLPIVLLLPLAACGRGSVTLQGTLADSTAATTVWVTGSADSARVEGGSFRLEGIEGDTVDLHFARAGAEGVRMRIHSLPDGGTVQLEGIWVADGLAFPARVGPVEGGPLVVNGLRMAGADAIPETVNVGGTVLALAEDADALVVRPADAGLPDLNVLITPGTTLRTADGEPVEAERLEFGDSVRVSGVGQSGHVVATEILVSRRVRPGGGDRDRR